MAAPGATPNYGAPLVPYLPSALGKVETVRGVRMCVLGLILDIVLGSFALLGSGAALLVVGADPLAMLGAMLPGAFDPAISGGPPSLLILGGAVIGLLITFVINFILALISTSEIYRGADEYGPEHGRNSRRGVVFMWVGTALSTTAAVLVAYLAIAGRTIFLPLAPREPIGFGGQITGTVFVPLLATVLWTGGVAAKAQMYRHMVRSLQPPQTRRWSDAASIVIPVLGGVGIAIVGFATLGLIALLQGPPGSGGAAEFTSLERLLVGGLFFPTGLAVAGYAVFLFIYQRTSQRLAEGLTAARAMVQPR